MMNGSPHRRRDTCRLCGSKSLTLVLPMPATPVGDAYVPADRLGERQAVFPLDVWLCGDCGLAQLIDVVDPEVLYTDYVYHTAVSLGLVDHFRRYATAVCEHLGLPRGGLVIDVGSNDGSLLQAFQERGMRVLGVDPARDVARLANERGVETINTFFDSGVAASVKDGHGSASLITANNVFANLDDLRDVCAGVRDLLAPDGVFVVETSYVGAVLEHMLVETIFHEHLSYFSLAPLVAFFRGVGLEVIDAGRQPTKGGSLRVFVQRQGGPRRVAASVGEVLASEREAGLHTAAPFHRMREHLTRVRSELRDVLARVKAAGGTVAGYGASVGVVTLLYEWELQGILEFLVDDHTRKQATFSPGQHIPVHAPTALYDRRVDAVLVLAWHYAAPIMKKHEAFAGEWIIPLPEVRRS